jgi:flagellar biosynthesis protein FliR
MAENLSAWIVCHSGLAALVVARTSGLAWTAPGLATQGLDPRLRLCLGGLLGLILTPAVGVVCASVPVAGSAWPALLSACVAEALIGAALGWSAALIIAGARQAGDLVGAQAGLSPSALFDPEAGDGVTPMGHLYGLVALGVFLALDGPLALMRALVESYRVVPPGGGELTVEGAALVFGWVGRAMALALQCAAPAALALALAGVALGLLGRAAPSLQLLALALPIRTALGMVFVLLGLATLAAILTTSWAGWPGPMTGL